MVQVNAYSFTGSGTIDLADRPPFDPGDPPPPITSQLVMVPSGPAPIFLGDAGLSFQMGFNQNVVTSTFTNGVEGNLYTFILIQDNVGGHTMTWPTNSYNGGPVNLNPSATTVQTFVCTLDGYLFAIAPAMWVTP
jgi:hypothetical protein